MNKHQQISQEIAWYFLFFSIVASLFCILLGWATMKMGLIPPPKNISLQMQYRAVFISFVLILSTSILVQHFNKGTIDKLIKNWGIPIVAVTTLMLLLLLPYENKLYLISCCGETNPSLWGFPFAWVECNGDIFCGLDKGRVDWVYALSDFWIFMNSAICFIGLAGIIFKSYRKTVAISRIQKE